MKEIDPDWPINKRAAMIVHKPKEKGVDFYCNDTITSMVPLPTKPFCGPPEHDLTGYKVGRFTVIGCALFRKGVNKKNGGEMRWVVRCSCGRYQMLSSRAIKKQHEFMACVECNLTNKLKRYERTR